MPATPAPLTLTDVAKRYGRRAPLVLAGVDLVLRPGSLVHVRGINGGGKSTLLRIIAGVSAPSKGQVVGRPRSVGYVPERFPATVRFTPRGYLGHLAAVRGISPDEGLDLLDRLGGSGWVDVPMTDLSKGSCQKVALAQALAGPAGLLVLDEAWTGLDTEAQATLTAEVHQRADASGIVVVTDHVQRPTGVRPTRTLLVASGQVSDTGAGEAPDPLPRTPMVVVLVGGPDAQRIKALPGVKALASTDQRLQLEVQAGYCDSLLAAALRSGWSVHEVRPK